MRRVWITIAGTGLLEMFADKMSEHLGVRVGFESVARLNQPFFDAVEVLDHPIVDHGDVAALVQVRVGVFVRGRAMRGPSSVADAQLSRHRGQSDDGCQSFVDLALFLPELQGMIAQNRHPGAVVSAIFEPSQPFNDDRGRLLLSDVSNDSAHVIMGVN